MEWPHEIFLEIYIGVNWLCGIYIHKLCIHGVVFVLQRRKLITYLFYGGNLIWRSILEIRNTASLEKASLIFLISFVFPTLL